MSIGASISHGTEGTSRMLSEPPRITLTEVERRMSLLPLVVTKLYDHGSNVRLHVVGSNQLEYIIILTEFSRKRLNKLGFDCGFKSNNDFVGVHVGIESRPYQGYDRSVWRFYIPNRIPAVKFVREPTVVKFQFDESSM